MPASVIGDRSRYRHRVRVGIGVGHHAAIYRPIPNENGNVAASKARRSLSRHPARPGCILCSPDVALRKGGEGHGELMCAHEQARDCLQA
jgi:hypothetical protein